MPSGTHELTYAASPSPRQRLAQDPQPSFAVESAVAAGIRSAICGLLSASVATLRLSNLSVVGSGPTGCSVSQALRNELKLDWWMPCSGLGAESHVRFKRLR